MARVYGRWLRVPFVGRWRGAIHERPCGPRRLEPRPPRRRGRGRADPGERPAVAGRERRALRGDRAGLRRERAARAGAASREPDRRASDARRVQLVRRRPRFVGRVAALHARLRRMAASSRPSSSIWSSPSRPGGWRRRPSAAWPRAMYVVGAGAAAGVDVVRRPARPQVRRLPGERVPDRPQRDARVSCSGSRRWPPSSAS